MSTQFRTDDDEFAFQRWCAGRDRGTCLEFLTAGNGQQVLDAALNGATFQGEDGTRFDLGDLLEFGARNAWTYGEFGGVTLEASEAFGFEWDQQAERARRDNE
jgi:hypothetical protein